VQVKSERERLSNNFDDFVGGRIDQKNIIVKPDSGANWYNGVEQPLCRFDLECIWKGADLRPPWQLIPNSEDGRLSFGNAFGHCRVDRIFLLDRESLEGFSCDQRFRTGGSRSNGQCKR
jgi:hypothetical protein